MFNIVPHICHKRLPHDTTQFNTPDNMSDTPSTEKKSAGKTMTRSQIIAKAALKTARSASTKAQTNVRKAISRANNTKLIVEQFLLAVTQAALDAETERLADEEDCIVTGTGMSMAIYDTSSDETADGELQDKNIPTLSVHDTTEISPSGEDSTRSVEM